MRKEKYVKIFTELEVVAKVQSIKNSNAIEGIVTSYESLRLSSVGWEKETYLRDGYLLNPEKWEILKYNYIN